MKILEEFIEREGRSHVRLEVIDALRSADSSCEKLILNFNTFNVTILVKEQSMIIADILPGFDEKPYKITLDNFFREVNLIEINKEKAFSQPSLVGRRLTVSDVVRGMYFDSLHYPITHNLKSFEIDAAISYCSNKVCLTEERVNFCDGCVRRSLGNKGLNCEINLPYRLNMLDNGYLDCFGSKIDEEIGLPMWGVAREIDVLSRE